MKVSRQQMAEARFTLIVHHVAKKNGCKVKIDPATKTVYFDGPGRTAEAVEKDMRRFFGPKMPFRTEDKQCRK